MKTIIEETVRPIHRTVTKDDIERQFEEQQELTKLLDLSIETNYHKLMYELCRAKLIEACQQENNGNRG